MKFLTFLNSGCIDICKNMIESARRVGIPSSDFIVYCLDDASYAELNQTVNCVRYHSEAPSGYKNWTFDPNSEFRQVVKHKWKIIQEVYKEHKSLCWVDTDIVFLSDIRDLSVFTERVLFQSDLPGSLICSGFMVFGDSINTQNLIDECASHPDEDDQLIINGIYQKHTIGLLDLEQFPNGNVYYKQGKKTKARIIHNNHMVGIDTKIQHFKNEGLWFV
jgi:hypothetical protein